MNYLFKSRILKSKSCKILLNSQKFIPSRFDQTLCLSNSSSKPRKNSKKIGKNSDPNKPGQFQNFDPLFDEILGILGTEGIEFDRSFALAFSAVKETTFEGTKVGEESSTCRLQGVCGNADEKKDRILVSDEMETMDVSSIVVKVIEIVRCENGLLSMEERLEKADIKFTEEVVVNVLKKCFKVPHLALRFFDWLKFREGFRHTTNTFNVMINVAREAKEFGLIEKLVEDMEKSSCEMNLTTWTVLVSYYGSTKRIAKALLMFDEMKKAGVEPDAVAYRTMLRVLCNAKKGDLALEFYKDIVRTEVNLDIDLYKQLLKCFALSGNIDAAHLVGENMIKLEILPESQVYGLMLKSFCITGKITESLELIRYLKNKNVHLKLGCLLHWSKGFVA